MEQEEKITNVTDEEMVKTLLNDVHSYENALEDSKKDLENYNIQVVFDEKLWEILEKPGSIRKIENTMVFETTPGYWELIEEKERYKIQLEKNKVAATKKQFEDRISHITEELNRAIEKYEKFSESKYEPKGE
jgi:hypothetical protein